jgi:hypothetical protein
VALKCGENEAAVLIHRDWGVNSSTQRVSFGSQKLILAPGSGANSMAVSADYPMFID